ncbi:MAG: hypothetical protein ACREKN_03715 [Longimicrobiaceae bacterium]
MNKRSARSAKGLVAVVALLTVTGCSQLGGLDQILGAILSPAGAGGQRAGEAVVQVEGRDTGRQILWVRTEDGQQAGVQYDSRTRVVYRQRQYRVSYLQSGDIVWMRIYQTGRGGQSGYYTDYIEIRERRGGWGW